VSSPFSGPSLLNSVVVTFHQRVQECPYLVRTVRQGTLKTIQFFYSLDIKYSKIIIRQHLIRTLFKMYKKLTVKSNPLFLPSWRDRVHFRVPRVHRTHVLPEVPLIHFVEVPKNRFQESVVPGYDGVRFRRHFGTFRSFSRFRLHLLELH